MDSGAEWLVRPAIRGMCGYESLIDGRLTLEHVAEMNDALDVVDENERRWQAYIAANRGR
jgi:hypothetical protein